MASPTDDTSIRSHDDLLLPFYRAEKPRSRWRIGTEAEKFGVYVADGRAIPYRSNSPAARRANELANPRPDRQHPSDSAPPGSGGVLEVLEALAERHGWFRESEIEGGEVIALRRGEASITLEPGGQLELSGAPQETVHQTCAEFRGHMAELRDISEELGILWLGLGFHPFARQADLPWVPKLRYSIMREYLPTRGPRARDMMLRTGTVQANVDYDSESDAIRKVRLSLRAQPIVSAMFANSPWKEGAPSGALSERGLVWLGMDPDRSGLLPFAWEDDLSYQSYVDWALDVPMFMLRRGDRVLHNTGQTFRSFLQSGFEGATASLGDWETHLNTLFPEVRLKKTIELRGADSQDTSLVCALPAIWKGLLYEETALSKAEALLLPLDLREVEAARSDIAQRALRATLLGREVAEWANELLRIAKDGLARLSHLSRSGTDETIHLDKLERLTKSGKSPADALLEAVPPGPAFRQRVMSHARV